MMTIKHEKASAHGLTRNKKENRDDLTGLRTTQSPIIVQLWMREQGFAMITASNSNYYKRNNTALLEDVFKQNLLFLFALRPAPLSLSHQDNTVPQPHYVFRNAHGRFG
jgi:hypothetical protein